MLAGKNIKPLRKREVEIDEPEPMEWQFMEDALATQPTGAQQVITKGHFKAWTYWELTKTHPEQASALMKTKKMDAEMKSYLQWVTTYFTIDSDKKEIRRLERPFAHTLSLIHI